MLKVLGGAVVYGLAAFGVYTLASCPRLKVVIEKVPANAEPDAEGAAAGAVTASNPAA